MHSRLGLSLSLEPCFIQITSRSHFRIYVGERGRNDREKTMPEIARRFNLMLLPVVRYSFYLYASQKSVVGQVRKKSFVFRSLFLYFLVHGVLSYSDPGSLRGDGQNSWEINS